MFIFHLFFPLIFRWEVALATLDHFNWALFHTYHLVMLLMAAFTAYVSIRHPQDLLESPLGDVVLLTLALVPIIRLAAELFYFGFAGVMSLITVVFSIIPAAIYLLAFSVRFRSEIAA